MNDLLPSSFDYEVDYLFSFERATREHCYPLRIEEISCSSRAETGVKKMMGEALNPTEIQRPKSRSNNRDAPAPAVS
jgi:hypothetical protein